MSDYRIQRQDLCMSDAAPFNQHWEARMAQPIAKTDMEAALQPCVQSLRAGDLINVTAYSKPDWRVMTEVASFRVVSVAQKIRLIQIGETVTIPSEVLDVAERENVRLRVVQIGSVFIVEDEKGNQIENFVDREQAEVFKRREEGRPRPTPDVKPKVTGEKPKSGKAA